MGSFSSGGREPVFPHRSSWQPLHREPIVPPILASHLKGRLALVGVVPGKVVGHDPASRSGLHRGRRSCPQLFDAGRFVIRTTHERGVGVPSSRSLATATREAKSVYEGGPAPCLRDCRIRSVARFSVTRTTDWTRGSICSQIPGVKPPVSDLRKDALSSSSSRASARPTAVISRALQISPPNAGAGTFSSAVDSPPVARPPPPRLPRNCAASPRRVSCR